MLCVITTYIRASSASFKMEKKPKLSVISDDDGTKIYQLQRKKPMASIIPIYRNGKNMSFGKKVAPWDLEQKRRSPWCLSSLMVGEPRRYHSEGEMLM